MKMSELSKVDGALFEEYVAAFGMIDSFCAPDITSARLESLMSSALKAGKPIAYTKEGWNIPGPDFVI